jgi:hypothetical protein
MLSYENSIKSALIGDGVQVRHPTTGAEVGTERRPIRIGQSAFVLQNVSVTGGGQVHNSDLARLNGRLKQPKRIRD